MLRACLTRGASVAASSLRALQGDGAWRSPLQQQFRGYGFSTFMPPLTDMRPIRGERRVTLTLEMIGRTFLVHSGKDFKKIKVSAQMVGHKMGEFVLTRRSPRKKAPSTKLMRGNKK